MSDSFKEKDADEQACAWGEMTVSVPQSVASGFPRVRSARRTTVSAPSAWYPVDTGPALEQLLNQYRVQPEPIHTSFRNLVDWLKVGERATHYLHPYPAKLFPHIAHFFLACSEICEPDGIVLDPFCGSGTVAVETVLSGRQALYADSNPLARLITRSKATALDVEELDQIAAGVQRRFIVAPEAGLPDVVNLRKWFSDESATELARLRSAIDDLASSAIKDFLYTTFSAVVRKASFADPRFSVPVRRKPQPEPRKIDIGELFRAQLSANRNRVAALTQHRRFGKIECAGDDARRLKSSCGLSELPSGSVGMVLTSPPYAGAQKYVRASSLSLGWLGLAGAAELRPLEIRTIGREHFPKSEISGHIRTGDAAADQVIERITQHNPTRATIAGTYLLEMRAALYESVRVLKPGGHFVLVIGDNTVCGERFASSDYLRSILEELGLETLLVLIDPIRARGLLTRRAATANIIVHEYIIVMRKPDH